MKEYSVQAQILLEIQVKASTEEEAQEQMLMHISNQKNDAENWDWNILIENQ